MGIFDRLFRRWPDVAAMAKRHDIEGLAKALHYRRNVPNVDPIRELRSLARQGVKSAIVNLSGENDGYFIRESAALALKEIGLAAMPVLVEALRDEHDDVRSLAAKALSSFEDRMVIEPFVERLNDTNPIVSKNAIKVLVRFGDRRVVRHLLSSLGKGTVHYEDTDELLNMVETMGPDCIEYFVEFLKDPDPYLNLGAKIALTRFCDTRAVEPLLESLNNSKSLDNSNDRGIFVRSVVALGKIKDNRAIEPLCLMLNDSLLNDSLLNDSLQNDLDYSMFGVILRALDTIGEPKARESVLSVLIHLLQDKNKRQDIRCYAAAKLGDLGDIRMTGPLTNVLQNEKDIEVCTTIELALQKIKEANQSSA